MTTYSYLDEMKTVFLEVLAQKSEQSIDVDDLSIDYNKSLEYALIKYLALLQSNVDILILAKKNRDELLMQSALLKLRTHAMSLSSFFEYIVEDTELILRTGEWLDIPDNK